jgi:hypothetical protein
MVMAARVFHVLWNLSLQVFEKRRQQPLENQIQEAVHRIRFDLAMPNSTLKQLLVVTYLLLKFA